jgi:hypothetical protein
MWKSFKLADQQSNGKKILDIRFVIRFEEMAGLWHNRE